MSDKRNMKDVVVEVKEEVQYCVIDVGGLHFLAYIMEGCKLKVKGVSAITGQNKDEICTENLREKEYMYLQYEPIYNVHISESQIMAYCRNKISSMLYTLRGLIFSVRTGEGSQ